MAPRALATAIVAATVCAVLGLVASPPEASAGVDVSVGLRGTLIVARENAANNVTIGETTLTSPAPGTHYSVRNLGCGGGVLALPCVRVRPGNLLCVENSFVSFCPRTAIPQSAGPGVRVRFRGGDDRLAFVETPGIRDFLADPFRVDAGAGDDRIRASSAGFVLGRNSATGRWTVSLGAGDDRYDGSLGRDVVDGGAGDDEILSDGTEASRNNGRGGADRIVAGAGDDVVDPGPGRDLVRLGPGRDVVDADDLDHLPDTYDGGPGFDRISYAHRVRGITAAAAFSSAGLRGEGDRIRGFERVDGGRGPDRLLGFRMGVGGRGNDIITGGNRGRFVLVGGPGRDILRGFAGDDMIDARDGQRDLRIECGAGNDRVLLDPVDPNPRDLGNCERIERRAVRRR